MNGAYPLCELGIFWYNERSMRYCILVLAVFAVSTGAFASWWWPFGGKEDDVPRISELLEPASRFIDAASDYADDGKIDEAVAEYRKALAELDRIELENPDRVDKPEFATVRNKRAYIESSIDSMLLAQARNNARAVAVSDTTELEKKYREELRARKEAATPAAASRPADKGLKAKMLQAKSDFKRKDYAAASATVEEALKERPNYAPALNLRGLVEFATGHADLAEKTFTQLIRSNPDFYPGYYNMAKIIFKTRGEAGREAALRYYDAGRDHCNGPEDRYLEEKLR